MVTTNEVSWTTVVARGSSKKVFIPELVSKEDSSKFKLVGSIMYEHEDLQVQMLARKATSIVQQALTSDSVLFSFPSAVFPHRTLAYAEIIKQCGPVDGVRPISLYGNRGGASGNLLVEAKFSNPADTTKAINDGVLVNQICYKASPSHDGVANGNLVHLKFSLLRIPNKETFLEDLKCSLRYYGEVYQVKKYTCEGFFEGQMSVMIDTSVGYKNGAGEMEDPQPLSRNLYLEAWDVYVPASFKGAAPVCHFCRQAGHLRSKCPDLAKRVCFQCRGHGHTARFCKAKEPTEAEELDQYVKDSGVHSGDGAQSGKGDSANGGHSGEARVEIPEEDAVMLESEEEKKSKDFDSRPNGTAASRFASFEKGLSMFVDQGDLNADTGVSGSEAGGASGGVSGAASGGVSGAVSGDVSGAVSGAQGASGLIDASGASDAVAGASGASGASCASGASGIGNGNVNGNVNVSKSLDLKHFDIIPVHLKKSFTKDSPSSSAASARRV